MNTMFGMSRRQVEMTARCLEVLLAAAFVLWLTSPSHTGVGDHFFWQMIFWAIVRSTVSWPKEGPIKS
jgi:hypothetical protein